MVRKKLTFDVNIVVLPSLLLIGGGMFIHSGIGVYGQEQSQQQPTFSPTFSSTNQTSEGWMTSFDLENCGFASTGKTAILF
jgi:hypothetical protein